ncbi:MAG: branched-chain-amino-acid transaminase [Acidimicrobiia bacterium]|nr:branched-chain-amino-acid transaminase [Acidimicrobiia bacterium]MDH4308384.1 branched-chain-amino-acid transaminase [Acidimicrobiia bacterium]MDH5293653.1 branched-chain-amino-acid transaminase [Acidimicrobiia bacterium]
MTTGPQVPTAPFGTVFAGTMSVARWNRGSWTEAAAGPVEPFSFHPATHVLHYSSACFEGLKAHRGADGVVRIFRLDAHVARMRRSAEILMLPVPPADMLAEMIIDVVRANLDEVPETPGSLYLRPTLIGVEENIGAAAVPSSQALLYVLASPVGDYFAGGIRPLKIAIETEMPRTTPQFGMVKSGANYVMALGPTMKAKSDLGVDQVLFAPGGVVQETGAANFVLIDPTKVVTPALSDAFLHGVTRDSLLTIASDLGLVVEEREHLRVDEVLEWAARPDAEAALSGTAAVLASVGSLVHKGEHLPVGTGEVGATTLMLRSALTEVHVAKRPDAHGWLTPVG